MSGACDCSGCASASTRRWHLIPQQSMLVHLELSICLITRAKAEAIIVIKPPSATYSSVFIIFYVDNKMSVRTCDRCTGTTKAGNRCRKRTCRSGLCWQHLKKEKNLLRLHVHVDLSVAQPKAMGRARASVPHPCTGGDGDPWDPRRHFTDT